MKPQPTHLFERDYTVALRHNGEPTCTCGRLQSNGRHGEPPEQSDEQRALDARRLGESEN